MYSVLIKTRTEVHSSDLEVFRALPTPDLVASSVAIARPCAFRRKARLSAVADAGATGVSCGQTGGILQKRTYDQRVASVAVGKTETQQQALVGTNLPKLWGKATGHPRFVCPNLFGSATLRQSRTYIQGTVLRPGPRPPDSKLVRRRLLRSLRGPGVFYAHKLNHARVATVTTTASAARSHDVASLWMTSLTTDTVTTVNADKSRPCRKIHPERT